MPRLANAIMDTPHTACASQFVAAEKGKAAPSRKTLVFMFFGFLLLYYSNGRAPAGVDTFCFPYTAWSIIRHGSMDLRYYRELDYLLGYHLFQLPDGSRVALRSPGCALVAIPVVLPAALLCADVPRSSIMFHFGKLTSAFLVALASVLFFLICQGLAPGSAWPATVLFGAGTCLFSVASQQLWTHGPATFWLCAAFFALLRRDDKPSRWHDLLAGGALGMAVLTRPTTAFFGMATALALLMRRDWRALFKLAFGAALPLAGYCAVNYVSYGNPFIGGYVNDDWTHRTPLWIGLSGLLFAPSRGLIVYTPAFVLLPLGLYALVARKCPHVSSWPRVLILCWLAAVGVTVVFFARWHDWYGGWCFGPRFLCECLPIACLLFALSLEVLSGLQMRRLAWGLVALSVFIHCMGVFGNRAEVDWYTRHERQNNGRWLFALHETQIEANTRAFFEKWGHRLGVSR